MTMRKAVTSIRVWAFFLAALCLLDGPPAHGQATTGTPPLGSFGGSQFDTINLNNLDVHFCIPVVTKAGRGLPFNYSLCYDSLIWQPVPSNGVTTWTPVTNWGWRAQTDAATGFVNFNEVVVDCYYTYNGVRLPGGDTATFSNWIYYDASGTSHPFSGSTEVVSYYGGTGNGCPAAKTTSFSGLATDNSGYTLNATGSNAYVTARDGTKFDPVPVASPTGASTVTDRNGNELSVSSSGVATDTLGSTSSTPLAITGTTSIGTSSSPTYYKYYAPSGSQVSVTMSYKSYTVRAQFGCSGINAYGPTTIYMVDRVTLPDNTYYAFTYELDADQKDYPGDITGRIKSVTLPTGGTITYNYTGNGSNGIFCSDGSTAGFTRVAGGETWSYTRASTTQTTVQDPAGNQEVLTFSTSGYETQRLVYQGAQSGGQVLQNQITCYNNNTTSCPTASVVAPVTQRTVSQNLSGSGALISKQSISYNNAGLPTTISDYDWGNGTQSPSRVTQISYASLSNGILDRPSQISTYDGSNDLYAQTTYTYDEGTPIGTSTPQHTTVNGSRGNPTTISYRVTGSTSLTKHFSYYDTGNVYQATDVNGAVTTYGYGPCGNSFVTSVALPVGGMSRSEVWNCNGGVVTSTTDENGQQTKAGYTDSYFWRPSSVTDPLNNALNFGYSGTAYESNMASGSSWLVDMYTGLDGLGRPQVKQHRQNTGSGNNTFDSVETDYDSVDRPTRVTMPYVTTTGGGTDVSAPGVTTSYDLLNRPVQSTDTEGGYTQYNYYYGPSAYDVLTTVGPAPGSESRQFQYDGLGRLTSVCELTSATGSGSCGQSEAQTGLLTTYVYTPMNQITNVTQNAQVSSPRQTRYFSYDDLGRLVLEANPETTNQQTGATTTSYIYDVTPSGCASGQGQTAVGDLATKTDQNGNTTSYCYDMMHRLVAVLYSGPNVTHCHYFQYDAATVNGVAMTYAKGRLAEAYTTDCTHSTKITDEGLSYNARGELTDIYESTANSGGYYHVSATYWPHGVLETLGGLPGLPNFTFTSLDGEGRVTNVQASTGQNPILSAANYNFSVGTNEPLGALAGITLGSGDKDGFQYDTNTGRQTQYAFTVNNQTVTGNLSWNTSGTLSQFQIADPFNGANTQTCGYSYDALARVSNVNCGTGNWNQGFYYASTGAQDGSVDAFGNITKNGSSSFMATYSTATNHFSLPGITVTYDNNGDLTYDGTHNYTWNAAGRPTAIDSLQLTYDAFNRLVEINNGSNYTQVVYAPTGAKLALMNGQTLQKAFVGLPGGATAVYNSSGLAYYRHADWLGSSRLASTPGGAATPKFVQVNSATPSSAQTVSVAFPSNQTAGDMNIVVVGWNDTTSSVTSVTDSNGNGGGTPGGSATFIQKASNAACSGTTCSMTVAATGAGHILVASAGFPSNVSIASVSGGGTWVCPAAAVAADGTTIGSAMCYVLSSSSGATTITITASASPGGNWVAEFREYSVSGTPVFDTAGGVDDSANCTSCSGVTLSLGGTNDLVVQMINPYGSATAVSAGWGDTDFPSNYFGVADELATGSGAAPTWTTSSGHATGSALAFNLGSSSGGGYTLAVGPTTVGSGVLGGAITQSIYYVTNIKGGANTVTVTFNQSAASPDVRILEYSGLSTSSPLDVVAAASGNSTAASSGSATTSSAAELIFGANTVYTTTKSAGTGFTSRIISPDGDIAEDENASSAGSYSATATLNSSGNWVMQMATFKAATTSGTSVYADVAYAPYGESYAPSGASDLSFTGQNNDTVSNLYDFLLREYHPVQGRWISPDPAGLAAVNPMNPQTWNRYAYVGNAPFSAVDALGLVTINPAWYMGFGADGGGCTMDGVDTPCNMVNATLVGGGAINCGNNCSSFNKTYTGTNGRSYTLVAAVDGPVFINDANGDEVDLQAAAELGLSLEGMPQNLFPGTNQIYWQPFLSAFNNALHRLNGKKCSNFFGGKGASTLSRDMFRFVNLPPDAAAEADSLPAFIGLNADPNGPFMNPPSFFLGASGAVQVRSFFMLHELGHQLSTSTGFFSPDTGSPLNFVNSLRVSYACY